MNDPTPETQHAAFTTIATLLRAIEEGVLLISPDVSAEQRAEIEERIEMWRKALREACPVVWTLPEFEPRKH
jgi:hypothetical protein